MLIPARLHVWHALTTYFGSVCHQRQAVLLASVFKRGRHFLLSRGSACRQKQQHLDLVLDVLCGEAGLIKRLKQNDAVPVFRNASATRTHFPKKQHLNKPSRQTARKSGLKRDLRAIRREDLKKKSKIRAACFRAFQILLLRAAPR